MASVTRCRQYFSPLTVISKDISRQGEMSPGASQPQSFCFPSLKGVSGVPCLRKDGSGGQRRGGEELLVGQGQKTWYQLSPVVWVNEQVASILSVHFLCWRVRRGHAIPRVALGSLRRRGKALFLEALSDQQSSSISKGRSLILTRLWLFTCKMRRWCLHFCGKRVTQ